jgi:hypothetical protein
MTHRESRRDVGISHRKVWQVSPNRLVKRELPGLDQSHHGGSGKGLGRRADLKESLFINGQWMSDVGDAESLHEFASLANDSERDARNLVPDHRVGNAIANPGEQFFDVYHAPVSA